MAVVYQASAITGLRFTIFLHRVETFPIIWASVFAKYKIWLIILLG